MSYKKEWLQHFHSIRRKVNFGWFLQSFEPLCLVGLFVSLLLVFYLKFNYSSLYDLHPLLSLYIVTVILLLCICFAWLHAKANFYSLEDVILRFDEKYHFNCNLIRAHHNEQAWPHLPDQLPVDLKLEWKRNSGFSVLFLLFLMSIFLMPVKPREIKVDIQEPIVWEEVREQIENLEEDLTIEKEQLKTFREQLRSLEDQDTKEWFSQNNLEASNSLKDKLEQAESEHTASISQLAEMASQVESLKEFLKQSAVDPAKLPADLQNQLDQAMQQMDQDWQQTLAELGEQLLKMRPDMLEQLRKMKPTDQMKSQLSTEEQKALIEYMNKKRQDKKKSCTECENKQKQCQKCEPGNPCGSCTQNCSSCSGSNPASVLMIPGISRGGGAGPELFQAYENNRFNTQIENVKKSEQTPGDQGQLLAVTEGEHKHDKDAFKIGSSGGADNKGQGSEAIWTENLLPEEQELLRSIGNE
ncbi:MAG: hypothetical protein MK193_05165 [Lentisphaeria bacterium]|nr:hypothetical protein [Lentisphaeria bacterium]